MRTELHSQSCHSVDADAWCKWALTGIGNRWVVWNWTLSYCTWIRTGGAEIYCPPLFWSLFLSRFLPCSVWIHHYTAFFTTINQVTIEISTASLQIVAAASTRAAAGIPDCPLSWRRSEVSWGTQRPATDWRGAHLLGDTLLCTSPSSLPVYNIQHNTDYQ